MSAHAPLAPSAAAGWIRCPASYQAQLGFPDTASREADEGSAMHEARALCLKDNIDPMELVGWVFFGGNKRRGFVATEAHMLAILQGIERIYDLCGPLGDHAHVFIEQSLQFTDAALADVWGTLDFGAALLDEGRLIVDDLKFGQGVPVYAKDNEQQLIYAALLMDFLNAQDLRKIKDILIIIDQPRIAGAGGEWWITADYLNRWVYEVLYPAVEAAKSKNPKFNAGAKQCFWCEAKTGCEAYTEFNIKMLGITFDDERDQKTLSPFTVEGMDPERLAYLVTHAPMFEKFLKAVFERALGDVLAGRPVPGWKAAYGKKGKRAWIDEEKAALALSVLLGGKAYETSVISPADAEKLLPRKEMMKLKDLWTQADPKPTLVPVENSKEEIPQIEMTDERES